MSINPVNLLQLIKNGKNPEQLMISILQERAGNNPLFGNLLVLAQQGNTKEIEKIARNLCQEKGIDFDKEFNSFKSNLGL